MNNSFRDILAYIHSSLYHTKSEFNNCDEPITLLRWDSKYSVLFFAPTGFSPSNPDVFSLFLYLFLYFIYNLVHFFFFCKKWGYIFKTSKGRAFELLFAEAENCAWWDSSQETKFLTSYSVSSHGLYQRRLGKLMLSCIKGKYV